MTSTAANPDPGPTNVSAPAPSAELAPLRRPHQALPRMWFGFAIAALCFLVQILGKTRGDATAGALLISWLGHFYWLFCVYRIHAMLKEATKSAYPISPAKAVGFLFIPLFQYYWAYKWPKQVAKFVNSRSPASPMRETLPGAVLASGVLLTGFVPYFSIIHLVVIFSVGVYINRKLRTVFPPVMDFRRWRLEQLNVSMSAGVGTAFCFVLARAVVDFYKEQRIEKLHDLAAIVVVSIGVLIFMEPVFEKLRIVLGVAEDHPVIESKRSWLLRTAVFAILVATSLFHGLLHAEIENGIKEDVWKAIGPIVAALLISGGITYFWISAVRRHPSRAARNGVLSGALIGFLVILLLAAGMLSSAPPARPLDAGSSDVTHQALRLAFPFLSAQFAADLSKSDLVAGRGFGTLVILTLPWVAFGLAGGLVIDKRWGGPKPWGVALGILVAGLLTGIILLGTGKIGFGEMISHLSAVVGWGLALIVCSSSNILAAVE